MADDVLIFNRLEWDKYVPRLVGDEKGDPVKSGRVKGVTYDQVLQEIKRQAGEIGCGAVYVEFSGIKDSWFIFPSSAEATVHYYKIRKEE